jgi:hypothetical protein
MELPNGRDVPFIVVNPTGNGFRRDRHASRQRRSSCSTTPLSTSVWRFGSKPNSKQTWRLQRRAT